MAPIIEAMSTMQAAWRNKAQIDAAVKRAEETLAPDVVRIRYSFDEDWTGDPSIFFRVVLSDEAASQISKLGEIVRRIEEGIRKEVDAEQYGLLDYFSYRSQAEEAELKEPAWA